MQVEGAVLDLTGVGDDDVCDIDALIAAMEVKVDIKPVTASVPVVTVHKTHEELLDEIAYGCHCSSCRRSIFSLPKIWKGKKMCANCHKQYRRNGYPREVTEFVRSAYRRGCAFCNIHDGSFHLDHINMFTKVNSVGGMMNEGASADDIIAEIKKCQLLCVNCHGLVTKFEWKCGFIAEKKLLNKAIAKGEDVTELRQRLHDEYEAVMTKMYPLIKEKAVRVWGTPVTQGCGLVESSDEADGPGEV